MEYQGFFSAAVVAMAGRGRRLRRDRVDGHHAVPENRMVEIIGPTA
jgi:hypothetical protein